MYRKLLGVIACCVCPLWLNAAEWTARPLNEIAIYPENRVSAQVEAVNRAQVAAQIAGQIESLPLRIGEVASRGAVLASIEDEAFQIALRQARAQRALVSSRVQLAQAQLEQSRALAQSGFISADGLRVQETELAVLRNELGAAEQGVAGAELQLARTKVRAPFDGVVLERRASVGDLATPGQVLMVVASTAEVEIHARVPSAQLAGLREAQALRLHLDGQVHPLRLLRILPVVDPAGQTQTAVFDSDQALAPGLAGELRWQVSMPHLPPEYLLSHNDQLGVWVDRAGQAVFIALPDAVVGRPAKAAQLVSERIIDSGRHALGVPRVAPQSAEAAQ